MRENEPIRPSYSALIGLASLFLSVGCGPADAAPDVTPFLGTFSYAKGSVRASCQGARVTQDIVGIEVEVAPRSGGLEFIAGPRCRVPLTLDGETARGSRGASCDLAIQRTVASAVFTEFSVRALDGRLIHRGEGHAEVSVPDAAQLHCDTFELEGTLDAGAQ